MEQGNTIRLPADCRLSTPRLALRPIAMQDAPGFLSLRSKAEVVRLLGLPVMTSLEQAEDYVAARLRMMAAGECLFWAVEEKAGGFCGSVCLWNFRCAQGLAELGYELLPAFWSRGYGSEAAAACLSFGLEVLGFSAIDALPDAENPASARLLERLGFVRIRDGSCPRPVAAGTRLLLYRCEKPAP